MWSLYYNLECGFFTSRLFLSLWQCIWEIQIVAMLFGNVGLVVFTLNLWWCSFKVQVVGVLLLLIMLIQLENGCCFGFVNFLSICIFFRNASTLVFFYYGLVMYFGNASTLVFFYYGSWWCILECRLPLALFIMDCGDVFWKYRLLEWRYFIMDYGDVFWKCKLLVLFIMHCGDVFWKCKLFSLVHLNFWSCFSKMQVIGVEFGNDFCKWRLLV